MSSLYVRSVLLGFNNAHDVAHFSEEKMQSGMLKALSAVIAFLLLTKHSQAAGADDDTALGFGVLALVLFAYFLPTFIAASRKSAQTAAIFILNLFLGWTFLGWVIALIWSFVNSSKNAAASLNYNAPSVSAIDPSMFSSTCYIRVRKPAFSYRPVYDAVTDGLVHTFNTEAEAIAHIARYRQATAPPQIRGA